MSGSKISRRYAKALLGLGQQDNKYDEYGQDLNEFQQFCSVNEEFFRVISSHIFSVEDKKNVLDYVLKKAPFSDLVKNFLRLLLDKNRIGAIDYITDSYLKFNKILLTTDY